MAVLLTENFTGTNGASWPSQWTQSLSNGASAAATIQSNAGRLRAGNGAFSGQIGLYANTISAADVNFCGFFTYDATNTPYTAVAIRSNSGGTNTTGYHVRMPPGGNLEIVRLDTSASLATASPLTITTGVQYGVRFRVIGTTIQARIWTGGAGGEPATWDINITNSAITAAGRVVVDALSPSATGGFVTWDDITITTGSETGTASSAITVSDSAGGTVVPGGNTASQTITAGATATASYGAVAAATASAITAGATATASYGAVAAATASVITATSSAIGAIGTPAFPLTPLPISVLLYVNGAYTDITSYCYGRGQVPITITRGLTSEGGIVDRQTMSLELDNRDGRFSPRNPTGPYYGSLGRNVSMALNIAEGGPYLFTSGTDGLSERATAPDSAGLSVTGDLDVRADLWALYWDNSADLVGKAVESGNQRSWLLQIESNDLGFSWSSNGSTWTTVWSDVNLPRSAVGRLAVRATIDVDNGDGGYDVTFYTASTMAGPWRQLGSRVHTSSGTTSIFDSTAPVDIGNINGAGFGGTSYARWYEVQVRNGIDGTLVANPIFADQVEDATVFIDDQGNSWTMTGSATLTQNHTRFVGEVSEWPQKWDTTGSDAFVPVQASGVLRRLGQGQSALDSTLRHAIPSLPALQAYWPCEDGDSSKRVAAGITNVRPMTVTYTGTPPSFHSNTDLKCSDALVVMNSGRFDGVIPAHTSTNEVQVRWLISVPSGGGTDLAEIVRVYTTGTAARWSVQYGTANGGSIQLLAYDRNDSVILTSGFGDLDMDGHPGRMHLGLTQNGSNIDWGVFLLRPDQTSGGGITGTLNSRTVGASTRVIVGKNNDMGSMAFGHLTVENDVTSVFVLRDELDAHLGETAGRRMQRLSSENGEQFVMYGNLDDTVPMGYQRVATYLESMRECAEADGGILFESTNIPGISYRSRASMLRQNTFASLSYPGHQMMNLDPVEDDRYSRNVVRVTRKDGGSATAQLTTGALSTQSAPNGIGRYDTSVTLSLADDNDCENQAYWRLHLGTVNEARYPNLTLNLASRWLTADPRLVREILDLDVGDRIAVTDPPLWVPPEDISQLVIGYTEKIGQFLHEITFALQPESPWRVGIYDDGVSRYSSDASELAGAHTSGTTSLVVMTPDGPAWSHSDGDFDIMVGGERMTVTAVASYSNLITNPSVETNGNGWASFVSNGSLSRVSASIGYDGTAFERITWTGASAVGTGMVVPNTAVTAGQTYTGSVWVRSSVNQTMRMSLEWKDAGSSTISTTVGDDVTCPANTWTQLYATGTAPALTTNVTPTAYSSPSGVAWANTNTLDGDAASLHLGSTALSYPIGDQIQTFTVTRAVNGVAKAHANGADVELFEPYYYSL